MSRASHARPAHTGDAHHNLLARYGGGGRHGVRCARGCGRLLVVALLRGETTDTARRICDYCAEARSKRLAAGAEPVEVSQRFARAVAQTAVAMGVAFEDNQARIRAGSRARLG